MRLPKIVFRCSQVYDRILYQIAFNKVQKAEHYFENRKVECMQAIAELEKNLQPQLPKILQSISEELSLPWGDEQIVIYILPSWHKSMNCLGFSDPLTIILNYLDDGQMVKINYEKTKYTIIHELCHVIQRPLGRTKYYSELRERRGLKHFLVANHLLTFSLLKKVLGDEEYYKLIKIHDANPRYKKAIALVEKIGAANIILEARKYMDPNL